MNSIAFTVFGLPVRWYGILMTFSIALAIYLCTREEKRLELPKDTILDLAFYVVPLAIVGARLYFLLFHEPQAIFTLKFFRIWEGGIAMYGSILGGLLGAFLFSRRRKISLLLLCDIISPGLILGQAIGRWGNFTNQEAYGELVTNPALQFFPFAVFIENVQEWHLATFFYESMWNLLVFCILFFYMRKNKRRNGDIFLWYGILYGAGRAIVEGLRMDSLYIGNLRVSQMLSLVILGAALVIMLWRKHRDGLLKTLDGALAALGGAALLALIITTFYDMGIWLRVGMQCLCSATIILICGYLYHTSKKPEPASAFSIIEEREKQP